MPLTVNWATTVAHKNPVICDPNHAMYHEVVEHLHNGDTWYECEETGQIQCQNRMLSMMPWLAMVLKLNTVTKQNVHEWYFRFRFACAHGLWGSRGYSNNRQVGVWGAEGWTYRDVTILDFVQCIGLTANVEKRTRLQWLKGVANTLADEMERKIRQGL